MEKPCRISSEENIKKIVLPEFRDRYIDYEVEEIIVKINESGIMQEFDE